MHDTYYELENRFVLFFDFLGASHAASVGNSDVVSEFIDLLVKMAESSGPEHIRRDYNDASSGYIWGLLPEFTTFSDLVVCSFSDRQNGIINNRQDWSFTVLKQFTSMIEQTVMRALRVGILTRGSITYGKLFHENKVIFGPALIEAHHLESKVAIYPRILVSDYFIKRLPARTKNDSINIVKSIDGLWYLDYFLFIQKGAQERGADLSKWRRGRLDKIIQELERLSCADLATSHRAIEKWEWFKNEFEKAFPLKVMPT